MRTRRRSGPPAPEGNWAFSEGKTGATEGVDAPPSRGKTALISEGKWTPAEGKPGGFRGETDVFRGETLLSQREKRLLWGPCTGWRASTHPSREVNMTAKKKARPAKKKSKRKPNPAFMRPMTPSAVLAAVVGSGALPRTQAVKKIWQYIKRHNLQDRKNRRNINADARLRPLFGGKSQATMFELAKFVNKHLK